MFSLETLKTKTFWAGVVTIVTGIGMYACGDHVDGIQAIITGIITIVGRDAITKLQAQK